MTCLNREAYYIHRVYKKIFKEPCKIAKRKVNVLSNCGSVCKQVKIQAREMPALGYEVWFLLHLRVFSLTFLHLARTKEVVWPLSETTQASPKMFAFAFFILWEKTDQRFRGVLDACPWTWRESHEIGIVCLCVRSGWFSELRQKYQCWDLHIPSFLHESLWTFITEPHACNNFCNYFFASHFGYRRAFSSGPTLWWPRAHAPQLDG